jgi:hypothetical protein
MYEMLCVMIDFLSIYLIILKISLLNWFNNEKISFFIRKLVSSLENWYVY